MIRRNKSIDNQAIYRVAEMMCAAARTAPKGQGLDGLESIILTDDDISILADEMDLIAQEQQVASWKADADKIRQCHAVVLLGYRTKHMFLQRPHIRCGYCGFANCAIAKSNGATCSISAADFGIAVGSAVSIAAQHFIDNKIYFDMGMTAKRMGLFENNVDIAYGIPLSVTGKNPFFIR